MLKKHLFVWLIIIFVFLICSMNAVAQTIIPSDVFITQNEDLTCTLAATTMMIRSRAYLSGASYAAITENSVGNTAWLGADGLSASFTYYFNGNSSVSVKRVYTGSMSVTDVKNLLNAHPEGVMLYSFAGGQNWYGSHAVFATDYEGDTIYCADPALGYSLGRRELASSRIGAWYPGQSNVLAHINYYWYISSCDIKPGDTQAPSISNARIIDLTSSGYTVTCNVADNMGVQRVEFPTWTSQNGQDDLANPWPIGSLNNGVASFRVNISDHNNERNCEYITHIYAFDYSGNRTSVGVSATVPSNKGKPLTTTSERLIPDGDYIIANAGSKSKATLSYLDIPGTNTNWTYSNTEVKTCLSSDGEISPYDVWTVSYDSTRKYYRIKQKNTNMALTVDLSDPLSENAIIQAAEYTEADAQYWKISQGGGNGYLVQAYCSGFALDVKGGGDTSGTTVQQHSPHTGDAEAWLFIPYNPSQPIDDGEYVILYTETLAHEVDLPGDTGDLANNTQIQIWKDTAVSKYNTYAFTKLSNGYYKIKHVESGKSLDVTGGLPNYKSKVAIHDDNGSLAQQWAVLKDGSGYSIISRCNGYALDLPNGTTTNGTGIEVYPRLNNAHQRWSLVKAKYTVSYDMNGGTGSISDQTKFYKSELTLSSTIPTKAYHSFLGWSASADATTATYSAGGTFTTDVDTTLYAVWKSNNYTLSYNGNGGSPVPAAQNSTGAAVTIPEDVVPIRPHYHFHGWAESATATAATYAPGDTYSKGVSTTLYAVWERSYDNIFVLPAFLTEIDDEAFLDTNADVIVIPATVTTIGENAFGDVVIYGYAGTAAETYADNHRLTFIPLTGNWVLESDMPSGAHVTDNKWTYTLTTTNTTTSTETSLEGWSLAGYEWQQTGTGTWKYASYPSGFDTGNSLYSKYNKSALAEGETITGNTKRVVNKGSTFITYIYWHWAFVDALNEGDTNSNVLVEDAKKYNVLTGNVYRDYIYFDAFEDTVDHGTWGPGTSGQINVDPMRYAWRDNRWDVSHWWWIFEVRQQTYTDYQKLFTYVKDESELLESTTEVIAGDGISNIQHWVKYGF